MEQFEYFMPDGRPILAYRDDNGNMTRICTCTSCLNTIRENGSEWDAGVNEFVDLGVAFPVENETAIEHEPEELHDTEESINEGESFIINDLPGAGTSPSIPGENVWTASAASLQRWTVQEENTGTLINATRQRLQDSVGQLQADGGTVRLIDRDDPDINPNTVNIQYERPSTSPETPAKNPRRNARAGSNGRQRRSTPLP